MVTKNEFDSCHFYTARIFENDESRFILQFIAEEGPRRGRFTPKQNQLLTALEQIPVTVEESVIIPSILAIFSHDRSSNYGFDEAALNSMRNVEFIIQFGDG